MRTLLILGAILAIGVAVYAHGPGYGRGCYGQGGYGPGMMGQKGYRPGVGMDNQNFKQFTADEARKTFETFISESYKGYKIEKLTPFNMPRGTVYSAEVSDASGNKFLFYLNPWGNVVGPITNR